MNKMTRKEFLRLTAGATAVATSGGAAAQRETAATLIRGADLLTMDPNLGEAGATDVLIREGRIAAVGKNLRADDAESIEASGMILMPGMIDGHRHVWEILDMGRLVKSRPAIYNATYQQWKMRTIVSMTPEDNYLAGLVGGLQAIDSGVTALVDYAHGQPTEETAVAAARGLKDSGIAGWFAFQLGVSSSYKPGDTVSLAKADGQRIAATDEAHWKTAHGFRKSSSPTGPRSFSSGSLRARASGAASPTLSGSGRALAGWESSSSRRTSTNPRNRKRRASWAIAIPAYPTSPRRVSWGPTTTSRTPTGSPRKSSECCATREA